MLTSLKVMTYIGIKYPGGTNKFLKDGGAVSILPEPTDLMYVVHPDLSEEIKTGLKNMFKNIVFGEKWNFEGASEEDYQRIQETIDSTFREVMGEDVKLGVVVNPCVLCLNLPMLSKSAPNVAKLVEGLSMLMGLERGCIVCNDGYIEFKGKTSEEYMDEEKIVSPSHHITSLSVGKPKRDKIIQEDEIINLRIALETASTLEEFLQQV